ncbi:transposase family protein, partial [Ancylomarina longa]
MALTPASESYDNLFIIFFSSLKDPRRITKGNLLHNLLDILFLTISAVVSGSDNWESINLFGKSQIDWLRQYRKFENGIPSADTLARVFAVLDPLKFE